MQYFAVRSLESFLEWDDVKERFVTGEQGIGFSIAPVLLVYLL
jgi:hypothetical protein